MKIEKEDASLPILPYDLIVEILSRLPIKSLLRFKSVSKSWLTLLTDSSFVKKHLNRSVSRRFVFSCKTVSKSHSSSRLVVFSYANDTTKAIHIDSPLPSRWSDEYSIGLYGSCDGLILCLTYPPPILLLLNPSTREQIRLPDSPFRTSAAISYGFGYDASTDDYKVVEMSSSSYDANMKTVYIYTLKSNSWRMVQDSPFSMVSRNPGTLVNGVLHWLAHGNTSKIVAFHLAEERFQDILLPCLEAPSIPRFIGVVRGCLCMTVGEPDIKYSEFWVMKEYGKRESWIKVARFRYYLTKPLDFTNNDEIHFLLDNSLLSYNLENNEAGHLVIPLAYGCHEVLQYREAEICLESVVSVHRRR